MKEVEDKQISNTITKFKEVKPQVVFVRFVSVETWTQCYVFDMDKTLLIGTDKKGLLDDYFQGERKRENNFRIKALTYQVSRVHLREEDTKRPATPIELLSGLLDTFLRSTGDIQTNSNGTLYGLPRFLKTALVLFQTIVVTTHSPWSRAIAIIQKVDEYNVIIYIYGKSAVNK